MKVACWYVTDRLHGSAASHTAPSEIPIGLHRNRSAHAFLGIRWVALFPVGVAEDVIVLPVPLCGQQTAPQADPCLTGGSNLRQLLNHVSLSSSLTGTGQLTTFPQAELNRLLPAYGLVAND